MVKISMIKDPCRGYNQIDLALRPTCTTLAAHTWRLNRRLVADGLLRGTTGQVGNGMGQLHPNCSATKGRKTHLSSFFFFFFSFMHVERGERKGWSPFFYIHRAPKTMEPSYFDLLPFFGRFKRNRTPPKISQHPSLGSSFGPSCSSHGKVDFWGSENKGEGGLEEVTMG